MSRTKQTITLPPMDLLCLAEQTTEYLQSQGFCPVQYNGSGFYRKRGGFIDPPQYIKFGFKTGEMEIEAFIQFPLFPGWGVGEMGIEGSFCEVKKTLLVRSINNLVRHTQKLVRESAEENSAAGLYPDIQCTIC